MARLILHLKKKKRRWKQNVVTTIKSIKNEKKNTASDMFFKFNETSAGGASTLGFF